MSDIKSFVERYPCLCENIVPGQVGTFREGVQYESDIEWIRDGRPPMPEKFRFSWHRQGDGVVWMTKSWRHDPMPFEMNGILLEIIMSNPWREVKK